MRQQSHVMTDIKLFTYHYLYIFQSRINNIRLCHTYILGVIAHIPINSYFKDRLLQVGW